MCVLRRFGYDGIAGVFYMTLYPEKCTDGTVYRNCDCFKALMTIDHFLGIRTMTAIPSAITVIAGSRRIVSGG